MLMIPGNVRLFLYQQPMSMRKSFEGLAAEIERLFPGEILSGAFFIFLNRRRDHIKILTWDGDGFAIYFKRLERGHYSWRGSESRLDRRDLLMLLEGITPQRLQKRFSL